jgi:hypothetical protein
MAGRYRSSVPGLEPTILAVTGGDPSVAGWVIFLGYFGAALLCVRALAVSLIGAREAGFYPGPERRRADRTAAYRASAVFWAVLAALLVFLGVNKQLDLQTWLTFVGRRIATRQGWYEYRGQIQTLFVLFVAIGGLACLAVLLKLTRDLLPRHMLAFFGLVVLAFFLLVRASSFHDVDATLGMSVRGIRVSWMLELCGIACIATSATLNSRWHRYRAWQYLRRWSRRHAA